jgi:zinc protease
MTGKNINVSAGGEGDSLTIRVQGSPQDLEEGLQLARAVITDGRIEESAFKNWKLQTLQRIEMMNTMPRFKAMEAMIDLLSGGDPRQKMITREDVERQSLAAAQKWFDRLCREAPIEVAVVGEIEWAQVKPLIEKYVGSLSERDRSTKNLDQLRRLARPTGPLSRRVDVETMTPQAAVMAGFAGCAGRNTFDTRALQLASNILDSRLVKRIREELAWVYSIGAFNRPSWVYEDAGVFASGAPCDPQNADKLADEIHALFKAFADHGPTDEELTNAKKQIANNLDEDMKEPRYWWRVLSHLELHGRDLNDEKGKVEDYQRYTVTQVRDVFRKYYQPTRQFRVTAFPTKAEAGESEKAKEEAAAPTS